MPLSRLNQSWVVVLLIKAPISNTIEIMVHEASGTQFAVLHRAEAPAQHRLHCCLVSLPTPAESCNLQLPPSSRSVSTSAIIVFARESLATPKFLCGICEVMLVH